MKSSSLSIRHFHYQILHFSNNHLLNRCLPLQDLVQVQIAFLRLLLNRNIECFHVQIYRIQK